MLKAGCAASLSRFGCRKLLRARMVSPFELRMATSRGGLGETKHAQQKRRASSHGVASSTTQRLEHSRFTRRKHSSQTYIRRVATSRSLLKFQVIHALSRYHTPETGTDTEMDTASDFSDLETWDDGIPQAVTCTGNAQKHNQKLLITCCHCRHTTPHYVRYTSREGWRPLLNPELYTCRYCGHDACYTGNGACCCDEGQKRCGVDVRELRWVCWACGEMENPGIAEVCEDEDWGGKKEKMVYRMWNPKCSGCGYKWGMECVWTWIEPGKVHEGHRMRDIIHRELETLTKRRNGEEVGVRPRKVSG
ncbi:hypothetical protein EX30DRAFT_343599 [Ascodesmis nigricans]|uniref:Uncharacterized protein n=1 Tax=Ascodesmis nigricans TaxID=341454 RepID=A0A4S2MRT6_9PEZI|nr:hypothetical protein EX30DRAFT_343599 [Ascodesmis nigricans]